LFGAGIRKLSFRRVFSAILALIAQQSVAQAGDLDEAYHRLENGAHGVGHAIVDAAHDAGRTIERWAYDTGIHWPKVDKIDPTDLARSVVPICWFSDRCWQKSAYPPTVAVRQGYDFYAVLRVFCVDAENGSDRGYQEISVASRISQQDAESSVLAIYNSTDVCRGNDHTRRASSTQAPQWMNRLYGTADLSTAIEAQIIAKHLRFNDDPGDIKSRICGTSARCSKLAPRPN
jgi:hypothetical protein